jgi:hypothetical protein
VQVWNPYLPLLPYLALLLACWGVAERDWRLLPAATGLAAAVVQLHVGYLPLVGLAAVSTAVAAWLAHGRRGLEGLTRGPVLAAVAVPVVLWIPPLWDQAFGHGNLGMLVRYFTQGKGDAVGLSDGVGLLSGHVGLGGPWAGGHERVIFTDVQPQPVTWLLVVTTLLVAVLVIHRRRRASWAALPTLALGQLAAGCIAASKVEPPVLSYLVVWMLPLAAFCWLAVAVTAVDALRARVATGTDEAPATDAASVPPGPPWRAARRPVGAVLAVAVGVLVVQTVRTTTMAVDPPLPRAELAPTVQDVARQLRAHRFGTVRVEGVGDPFNEAWVGVVYVLAERNVRFLTADGADGRKWGDDHVWRGQRVDAAITIATSLPTQFDDPVATCLATPGVRPIALVDHLSAAERNRLKGLQIANYQAKGRLRPEEQRELDRLSARAYRLGVFEGDALCGGAG